MKFTLTGSLGHITQPLAANLVAAGHQVSIITSTSDRVAAIESLGAKALVGSVEDANFIETAFNGADAVYLMIPPKFVDDWRSFQDKVSDIYVAALEKNKIKYAVVLSSIGAHMRNGAGQIDGLAYLESRLSEVPDLNAKFLRPSYFYLNLFNMIPVIKGLNIMGSNFGGNDDKIVLTHTNDIATAATEELLALNFSGHTHRYIASDEKTGAEIATILGAAINKEGIPWVEFTDQQSFDGMVQAGLPKGMADGYTTMGRSIRNGTIQEDYFQNRPSLNNTVKIESFAEEFAKAYSN